MNIKRTIITTIVALALVAVVAPAVTQADQLSDLMALVTSLQAQIAQLQGGAPAVGTGACAGVNFQRTLVVGSTGSDVKCLQTILNQSATTQVSATGAGSPGLETTYFGPKTLVAVRKYQVAQGFTPANQVGPMTRAALNAAIGGVPGTPGTPAQTGPISAMKAADSPASGALVNNQAGADLLHINLTGTGTVSSMTLQRSGISTQNTLSAVYLYDGNTRITGGYSFNTSGQLVMNNLNLAISGSKVISVRADVYSTATTDSSSVAVALVGLTANGVATTANVAGNMMTVVNGDLARADFPTGNSTSPGDTSINAGTVNQTLWSRSIGITPRAIQFYGLTVKMIGSAPSNSLANVGLYIDGILAGTATINANNQFVFSSANPVTLTTGSHFIEVRGDVIGGADRSLYLSLEQGSDVIIKDSQLGVYVSATTNTGSTATNLIGGTVAIQNGTLTVNQDTSFNTTTTVVGGASNVQMAAFKFTAYGEDVKVTSLSFLSTITGGPGGSNTMTNVGLYVNGGQVGSNYTATSGSNVSFANLGSSLLVPVGTPVIVAIKGDVIASTGAPFTTGTVKFDLNAGTSNVQGMSSSKITSSGSRGGQSLAISSTNVTFAATTGFAAAAPAPNASGVKLGSFTFQTGSAEGATINNVAVTLSGNMVSGNQLTNLTLKNGTTVVSTPIGTPIVGVNNYSVNIPVALGASTTLDVYGDVGSAASTLIVTPSMLVTYRGAISNISSTTNSGTPTAGVATTCTVPSIIAGGVTSVPGSSLAAQYVTGNAGTLLDIVTFNVKTNNNVGGAILKDLTFTTTDSIASVTVNGLTASAVGGTAIVRNINISVPSDNSGVNIPVKTSLVCIGSGCSGISNENVVLSLTTVTYDDGTGIQTISPTASSSTLKLVSTVPTVALTGSSTTGLQIGNQKIGTFTVAAGPTGDIKLENIPVITGVSGTVTITAGTVELRDQNGSVLSDAPSAVNDGTQTFTFSTPHTIARATSQTFTVYATVGGSLGSAGTSNVSFSLGAKGTFTWTDVTGSRSGLTGTNIYTYSTDSQTKSN